MMIADDVDEAIYMSDRIVLMANGLNATIGEILMFPFAHPHDRHAIRETPNYYYLKNHALDFLEHCFSLAKIRLTVVLTTMLTKAGQPDNPI